MNLTAGTVLQKGQYIINATLGEGLSGITYRATQTDLNLPVAIKTLNERLRHQANFQQIQKTFQNLACRLRECQHPNLVQVFDCFEQAGFVYMVMEYIPGQTLAELIQFSQLLPQDQTIDCVRQIGAAVSALHRHGLFHGDIKPQNIIRLEGSKSVVLTDFNITCELNPTGERTDAGLLSAGYAPADIKRNPATDIYGLAATFYGLLTGQPPVGAPLKEGLFFPNGQQFQANLNPAVLEALRCGLEIEAHRRPQTVEAWLALLPDAEAAGKGQQESLAQEEPECAELAVEVGLDPAEDTGEQELESTKATQISKPHPYRRRVHLSFILTAAIAGLAGASFGLSLRFGNTGKLGSRLFNTEQTFPPLKDWPATDTPGLSPYALVKKSFSAQMPVEPLELSPESDASPVDEQPELADPLNEIPPPNSSSNTEATIPGVDAGASTPLRQSSAPQFRF